MIGRILDRLVRESEIGVRSHLCSRVRFPRSGCRACLDVCPAHVVEIGGDTVRVGAACSGCEACITACPNGVFSLPEERERERRRILKGAVQADPVLRVTCSMHPEKEASGVWVLPCLAALGEAYLVAALAWGGREVEITPGPCGECPLSPAMTVYRNRLERAGGLLSCFGISGERIREVPVLHPSRGPAREEAPDSPAVGRREFFGLFRRKAAETAARLAPETDTPAPRWSHREHPARGFLLDGLARLGEIRHDSLQAGLFPGLDLAVSDACIACKVCETLCPTGAIRRERVPGEGVRLLFNLSLCTGCRICGEACHPRAITFGDLLDLREILARSERELILVRPKTCRVCGEGFEGVLGDLCPACFDRRRPLG